MSDQSFITIDKQPHDFELYSEKRKGELPDFLKDDNIDNPVLYKASPELRNAVNVALTLGKPLLLTGEPGTGKSQLAFSIAHNLGLPKPYVFNTRTSSTAQDLFYTYNALGHFHYAQIATNAELNEDEIERRFITYQALGKAIISKERHVVLIDEIDKAPRDLPNDVLNVIEELTFTVPEIKKSFSAPSNKIPIIILTSNSEKNLPDAFLRRCVFYHIPFPDEDHLITIITAKISSSLYNSRVLKETVVPHFMQVRNALTRKKPGTAELLYWISLLNRIKFNPQNLQSPQLSTEEAAALTMSYSVLAKSKEDLEILKRRVLVTGNAVKH